MWTSPYPPVEVGGTTLPALVDAAIAAHPDRTALVDGPSGASVTYAELGRRVTFTAVPPPVAAVLANGPALSTMELVAVGGAPLPLALHQALAARLPRCVVGQGWGLTETTAGICVPDRLDPTRRHWPPGWPTGSRRTSGRAGSPPSTGCRGRRPASCSAASCADAPSESLPT